LALVVDRVGTFTLTGEDDDIRYTRPWTSFVQLRNECPLLTIADIR